MKRYLRLWQVLMLVAIFVVWQVLSQPGLLPPVVWDNPHRASFFLWDPLESTCRHASLSIL